MFQLPLQLLSASTLISFSASLSTATPSSLLSASDLTKDSHATVSSPDTDVRGPSQFFSVSVCWVIELNFGKMRREVPSLSPLALPSAVRQDDEVWISEKPEGYYLVSHNANASVRTL